MTPHQADVWEILAAATDELLRAHERRRRAGLVLALLKKVKAAKEAGRPIKGLDAETLSAMESM